MANYEDDDLDEGENGENGGINEEQPVEQPVAAAAAAGAAAGNRNFILALGILGGIFVLLIIALAVLFLNRRPVTPPAVSNVEITNVAIMTANAQTAVAATQTVAFMLTPSATLPPTNTPVPPTATNTQVVAQATSTNTTVPGPSRVLTEGPTTPAQQTSIAATQIAAGTLVPGGTSTATMIAAATLSSAQKTQTALAPTLPAAQRTQTAVAQLTATKLPTTGFAEDAGLPGLFGLALGLILVIVLVRRLRLSTNG
ncbi:MAG TPA: hypothetical protein VF806_05495 [Anaerolineaceae bacterium]